MVREHYNRRRLVLEAKKLTATAVRTSSQCHVDFCSTHPTPREQTQAKAWTPQPDLTDIISKNLVKHKLSIQVEKHTSKQENEMT